MPAPGTMPAPARRAVARLAAGATTVTLAFGAPLVGAAALHAQPTPPAPPTVPAAAPPCEAGAPTRDAATRSDRGPRVEVFRAFGGEPGRRGDAAGAPRPVAVIVRPGPAGWLGISTVDVSDLRVGREGRIVRYCAYPEVVSVEPDSPAARAGLSAGDVIVAYDGRDLVRGGEVALDRLFVPGRTVRVSVRRDGRTLALPVVVGARPAVAVFRSFEVGASMPAAAPGVAAPPAPATAAVPATPPAPPGTGAAFGFSLQLSDDGRPLRFPAVPLAVGAAGASVVLGAQMVAMDDDLREALDREGPGVLVVKVLPGTASAAAGLRAGDVVVRAEGTAVATPGALQRLVLRAADARELTLRVERRGKGKDVLVRW